MKLINTGIEILYSALDTIDKEKFRKEHEAH